MLGANVLKQGQGLAHRTHRGSNARFAIDLGGGVLGLEQGADCLSDVLGHTQYVLGNVRIGLKCFEHRTQRRSRFD